MGKSNRSYPEADDSKKKVKNQRERIKQLEREVKRLKGELHTLNVAFKKSADFMSDEVKPLTVEKLIKAADSHQTLKEAKKEHEERIKKPTKKTLLEQAKEQQEAKETTRLKWKKWAEEKLRSGGEESEES